MAKVLVKKLNSKVQLPKYKTKGSSGMDLMAFIDDPIEISPNRLYNCSYLPVDSLDAFNEIMFLLLSGCGVGYSVQQHHIKQLPFLMKPFKGRTRRFVIGDSIEGWSDADSAPLLEYLYSAFCKNWLTFFIVSYSYVPNFFF